MTTLELQNNIVRLALDIEDPSIGLNNYEEKFD
jgi:hypothetical protein